MKVAQQHGSSLIEALVATLILTTGVVTMAQLISIATATNLAARRSTVAAILAEQKLEQLQAPGLQPSPSSALVDNTAGFVDHIGQDGRIVGSGTQPPPGAVYTRRWSIEPIVSGPESALVIQVLVTASNVSRGALDSANRVRGEARVVTVKARNAQ